MSVMPAVPARFFRLFLETLNAELGSTRLALVLEKGDLQPDQINPQTAFRLNSAEAAETYTGIQRAMRVYYGRGARGTLVRIGRILWERLLENGSLPEKIQAQLIRSLPTAMRLKPILELLAHFMRDYSSDVTVHTLDVDLLLVDHASAAGSRQESAAVCNVTLGLIQEALFWASATEYDVEEVSCRATGGESCEFKISLPRK